MNSGFKDHFSLDSDNYRKFRPQYPEALFAYLASVAPSTELAWDCATGTGQTAQALAPYFQKIMASDPSSAQIENAVATDRVHYFLAGAEHSGLENNSIDLITVSQALHWFDTPAFFHEAERVLKANGILAVWSYNLLNIRADIDAVINHFYAEELDTYWPPERKLIEADYCDIEFPFQALEPPAFAMQARWNLEHLLGYLSTWSAVKRYQAAKGHSPIPALAQQLLGIWGEADTVLTVTWPLNLIVRKKTN